jgi:hypothetical protein
MKKLLTILTGIVFLTAILVVFGCPTAAQGPIKIDLKITEINGEKHFTMEDDLGSIDVPLIETDRDTIEVVFYTAVQEGRKVQWRRSPSSGIRQINKIVPVTGNRKIFKEDPKIQRFSKGWELQINWELTSRDKDQYIIEFIDKEERKIWIIDPYLRVDP